MDFKRIMGAQIRGVDDREHNGAPARVVIATRTYDTQTNDLWDAITNPERLPRWFLPISGDLRLNGRYQLEGHAGGLITRCDPPEALDVTWETGGNISWVTVRLAPDGAGTRLTLEHAMPKDPESEAHWEKYGPGATGVGWDLTLAGIDLHLPNPEVHVDRKQVDGWMASDPGKAFIKGSASAWGDAHIKAGEAPDIARGMAERTAKFYTGE